MDKTILRINELEKWLSVDFVIRMETIRRCRYFGITPPESELALQKEAYAKDREYRRLKNMPNVPEMAKDIIEI